jgi:adenylate kinase family enzyme
VTVASLPDSRKSVSTQNWTVTHAVGPFHKEPTDKTLWRVDRVLEVVSAGLDRYLISFPGVAQFDVDFARQVVHAVGADASRHETVRHLLANQIWPRIIAHQGELVIHAAGLLASKGAILLLGSSGSGKSTLAASLDLNGFPLLGDDAMEISRDAKGAAANSLYRSLRLFPDSIAALIADDAPQTPIADYTPKRNILCPHDERIGAPVGICGAFVLDSAPTEDCSVERMSGSEACMAFVEHSFWMDPTDIARTKERMSDASALAVSVPTFRLAYPRDYSALPAVHDAVAAVLD